MRIHKEGIYAAISLLALLTVTSTSQAYLGSINLHISAIIVANTCTVSVNSQNRIVDMGVWGTKQFAATPEVTPLVPFTINLENCGGAAKGVEVIFNGTHDPVNNSLLAIIGSGSAKNIAVSILDRNRIRIPLGESSIVYGLYPNAKLVILDFYAQYVGTGGLVTPGLANADTIFTLDYQ